MINILLYILEKIPYRTKCGLSLCDLLKEYWYKELNHHDKCICGGSIVCYGTGNEGWEVVCLKCDYTYGED